MPTNGQFTVGELVTSSDANQLFTRGYQNRIINGAFIINQRAYASGTNLASGVYGLDRWKSAFTNTSLTFTAGSQSTTVTINQDGIIQQIIERENIPAGTYCLSFFGTATGRVYNVGGTPPAFAASGLTVALDGLADVVVEFTAVGGTRTLGQVQLEAGTVFSPFEFRHRGQELALCQRYCYRIQVTTTNGRFGNGMVNSSTLQSYIPFPVTLRSSPTAVTTSATAAEFGFFNLITAVNCNTVPFFDAATPFGINVQLGLASTMTTNGGQLFRNSGSPFIQVSVEL